MYSVADNIYYKKQAASFSSNFYFFKIKSKSSPSSRYSIIKYNS